MAMAFFSISFLLTKLDNIYNASFIVANSGDGAYVHASHTDSLNDVLSVHYYMSDISYLEVNWLRWHLINGC